jgi:hypothetical protein
MLRRTFIQGSTALALAASTGMLMTVTKARQAFAATPGGAARAVIPEHPRLMLHNFEAVKALVAQDSSAAAWYAKVKADADTIRTLPVSKYEIPDGLRLLSTSREVVRRTYSLAIAHALEGDPAYAERLWQELDAVAKFPDWNSQRHFLDTAEMTHAVAIGYDWLYHTWTEAQRAVLRQAIVGFGLNPGMAVYNSGFGWPNGVNNWNIVCNGGLSLGALALAQDEPELSTQILGHALASIPKAIAEYGPDGGYPEGLGSYWGYATKYLVPFVESLKTATGDDHGFSQSPGLDTTGLFPIHLTGPGGENFNYYDAGGGSPQPPEMFWLARTYGNPVFGWWGKLGADKNPVSWFQSPAALLWYDPDLVRSPVQAELAPDAYFGRCEVVTMRSGWENPKAVFAGFKGGDNTTNHGNLDLGTFVLDALGVRWAIELGGDDYNMPGYFSGGPGGQRWTYYRNRGEGQNTLIANPGTAEDQVVRSIGTITARASGPTAAYAIADLTESNPALTSWRRGARLFDNRQQLVVQDELTASEPAEIWWFLHTSATITVAADGKSALLERSGLKLLARITSPGDAVFYNADARPLWTSPDPDVQNDNLGIRKLAIRLRDVTSTRLTVQLTPVRDSQETPGPAPVTALSDWNTGPANVALLKSLALDDEPVAGFSPRTFVYDKVLARGAGKPRVTAKAADPRARVVVHPIRELPGPVTVEVVQPSKARGRYQVFLGREAGPGWFPMPIIASADDGNVPQNTMDGNPATRWSADGDGQWIGYDLGSDGPVSSVTIAWYQGKTRSSTFDIEVATADGEWERVFSGSSSGTQDTPETYTFAERTARYLRIVGHGNSANSWNSITEVTIPGRSVQLPEPSLHLESVTVDAPASVPIGGTAAVGLSGTMSDGSPADLAGFSVTRVTTDPAIATIDADGRLTAVAEGSVTVAGIVVTDDWRLVYGRRTVSVDDPNVRRFTATADTYVNDGANAGTNYGTSQTLLVKTVRPADTGFTRQAYLRFEPAAVSGTIVSIGLDLYASVNDSAGTESDIDVMAVVGTFEERTTTWNSRPTLGAVLGTTHVSGTAPAWRTVDLTEALRSAVAAGSPITLAVVQNPPVGQNGLAVNIRSRESAQPPRLVVRLG